MDKLSGVLQMILPVLLMLCAGMLCRKKGIVKKQGVEGLKTLAVNICLPAMLLRVFSTAAYSLNMLMITVVMFIACGLALLVGFIFSKFVRISRITPFLFTCFEAGMLGYALYTLMFGTDAVSNFATVDLGAVLFGFTVYLTLLRRSNGQQKTSFTETLKDMARSPILIMIVLGVIIGASGLGALISAAPAGSIIWGTLEFIGAPTSVVILFVVGYELVLSKQNLKSSLIVAASRLVVMAVICALILLLIRLIMPVSDLLMWAFILMFILPPPYVLPIFTTGSDEASFASATLSMHTLLTLIAFGVIAVFVA